MKKKNEENNKLKSELEHKNEEGRKFKELNTELEQKVENLNSEIFKLNEKATKEREDVAAKGGVQLKGLGVMKKNLEEHIEDLHRWQKYLDIDKNSIVDFSGEIRPQILSEITSKDYDEQLKVLASKLAKENSELEQMLKTKEEEKRIQKAKEDEKKKKKGKESVDQ